MPVPDPDGHGDVVLLGERGHPAPGPRFGEVAELRADQFRQSLALNDRPGGKPGEHARREHVKPNQIMIKGQANYNKEENVRNGNSNKNSNPGDGQRSRQPKVIKFIEPFFDPPDICVGGKVH
jgi:hypothetical protein